MKTAFVVQGLLFGDESKGTIVEFLTKKYDCSLNIRFHGGPQASHNVYWRGDNKQTKHHAFHQFGSGTPWGAKTYLAKNVLVSPNLLINEAEHLEYCGIKNPLEKIYINPYCPVITPWQVWMNRLRELARGKRRHGSCGLGIGETREDSLDNLFLTVSDLGYKDCCRDFLRPIKEKKEKQALEILESFSKIPDEVQNEYNKINNIKLEEWIEFYYNFSKKIQCLFLDDIPEFNGKTNIVFEGAQGLLLDEKHGWQPHTTWSDCTAEGAFSILHSLSSVYNVVKIGVTRTYASRHGLGPFPTENKELTEKLVDENNPENKWQGKFRCGFLDFVLLNYAIKINQGIDFLAITHTDKYMPEQVCLSYQIEYDITDFERPDLNFCRPNYLNVRSEKLEDIFSDFLKTDVPIGIISNGKTCEDKIVTSEFLSRLKT